MQLVNDGVIPAAEYNDQLLDGDRPVAVPRLGGRPSRILDPLPLQVQRFLGRADRGKWLLRRHLSRDHWWALFGVPTMQLLT